MKTYKNITDVEQLDIEPGQTGDREISSEEEGRMVARGAIEVVGEPAEETATAEPEKTAEEIEAEEKAAEEAAAAEAKKAEEERERKEREAASSRGRR